MGRWSGTLNSTSNSCVAYAISTGLIALLMGVGAGCLAQSVNSVPSHQHAETSHVQTDAHAKLGRYMDALGAQLDTRAQGALTRIDGTARRLLALRGYVRIEGGLAARWSWTAEEIKRFENSAEYRTALNEVEKVRQRFAALNPGYELYVNTQVRTLEKQIKFWNENKSVQSASDQLLASTLKELSGTGYADTPDASSVNRFRQFLKSSKLAVAPTVATPGLSQHGQLRAFDFQVQSGGKLVAGTDSTSIVPVWEGQGWTKKLNEAVTGASNKFKGPLVSPREPWHYEFVP